MTYRQALRVYWRKDEQGGNVHHRHDQVERARRVIAKKCAKYGSEAKRHTIWCCEVR